MTKSLSYFSSTLKHRRAIRKEMFSSFFYFQRKRGRLLASMDAVWMHIKDQQGRAPKKRLRNNELTNQQSVTPELMGACVIDLSFASILPARIVSFVIVSYILSNLPKFDQDFLQITVYYHVSLRQRSFI